MEPVPLSSAIAAIWDDLVRQSDNAWITGLAAWQPVAAADGVRDMSFALQHDGRLVATMPLQFNPFSRLLASTTLGYGGPSVLTDVPANFQTKILAAIFAHVRSLAAELSAARIEVSLCPLGRASSASHHGVNFLVDHGFRDTSTHVLIADLTKTEADLWADLSQDARQQIKKATKAGYRAVAASWPDSADNYYRIHSETYQRTGHLAFGRHFHAGVVQLSRQGHALLWAGQAPNGEPIAYANCGRMAPHQRYWTGCCESAHLESGISYLMLWEAMLAAQKLGDRRFEIGEVFPGATDGKLLGLSRFKSKFGGERHRLFRGEIDLPAATPAAAARPFGVLFAEWRSASQILAGALVRRSLRRVRATFSPQPPAPPPTGAVPPAPTDNRSSTD